jgi:hypothetical protein
MVKRVRKEAPRKEKELTKKAKSRQATTAAETKEEHRLTQQLVDDWHFSDADLARTFVRNGIAKVLRKLEKDGFTCSESDPLLIISVDWNDDDSVGYFNEGNYGIAAATPGHLPAPLPAPNVRHPGPCAVGRFLHSYEGVEDTSGGDLTVLYFASLGTMHAVRNDFSEERQFLRVGSAVANLFGVPQEESLVNFFTLDKMKSEPMPYEYFNVK